MNVILFVFLVLFSISLVFSLEEARVLRFPSVHQDQVVFTYAGDLYTVSFSGGIARKLTSHPGYELFARFSPDGRYIAFTAEYDGNREVYVIPREGGVPKRITFTPTLPRDDVSDRMGPNNIVLGWTHDNKHIVFRSRMREWNDFNGQLYLVSLEGGIPKQLPLPRGGFCSFSDDDSKLAYNRVFREFRTWKRYRGGMADDIWIYDFKTKKIENITKNPAQDVFPIWKGNKIYFLSDRDELKRMNLYLHDLESRETRKLTDFKEFDIKFPSLGERAIVFENGGYLYSFDLESEEIKKIPVIISDDLVSSRSRIIKLSEKITNYEISPDGKRALFGARGEVFTVPLKEGNTRNITETPGIHERSAKWSPDGKWVAYISDATGEDEIYLIPQDGSSSARQITEGADTYKYEIFWSPDSKKILWSDKLLRLCYVNVETKKVEVVDQAKRWEIRDYCWAPDSNWIAYAKPEVEGMTRVYLHDCSTKKTYPVTQEWYSSYAPSFHSEGKYLFFVSDRDFNPVFSRTEWNHAYLQMARIYLVTLSEEVRSPFEPKSDEVGSAEEKKDEPRGSTKKAEGDLKKLKITPEGLEDRIIGLPIQTADYWHLTSVGNYLYYLTKTLEEKKPSLKMFDFEKRNETNLGEIDGYEISSDQKKMLVLKENSYAIIDVPKNKLEVEEKLDLSQLEVKVEPREEWKQIFRECWRQMKYFFYDPGMHGADWEMIKKSYEPLAESVNHRADLTYVIGEMIGELNVGHTYVGGGDIPQIEKVKVGMLGAEIEKEEKSGFFKIKRILKGENWDSKLRSPLTEIGVNASEGDFILAINGTPTKGMKNMYEYLVNTVGKQVRLRLNKEPKEEGSREVVVVPIEHELRLYYYNWVQQNIEKVSRLSEGKVGYIHIPNMGPDGLNEFVKHFYPQLQKKALIIDVRGNGGGSVSPMIIERLRREMAMVGIARNTIPAPDPEAVFLGPMVCLMDEFSASDGDIFPYRFKKHKLGKLVGKRTWGGVVGIRETLPLLDGGYLYKPEFAVYSEDGKEWIIEGHGVEPDVYVDNDPSQEYEGVDEQLLKAVEVVLEELKSKEKEIPGPPPYPKK